MIAQNGSNSRGSKQHSSPHRKLSVPSSTLKPGTLLKEPQRGGHVAIQPLPINVDAKKHNNLPLIDSARTTNSTDPLSSRCRELELQNTKLTNHVKQAELAIKNYRDILDQDNSTPRIKTKTTLSTEDASVQTTFHNLRQENTHDIDNKQALDLAEDKIAILQNEKKEQQILIKSLNGKIKDLQGRLIENTTLEKKVALYESEISKTVLETQQLTESNRKLKEQIRCNQQLFQERKINEDQVLLTTLDQNKQYIHKLQHDIKSMKQDFQIESNTSWDFLKNGYHNMIITATEYYEKVLHKNNTLIEELKEDVVSKEAIINLFKEDIRKLSEKVEMLQRLIDAPINKSIEPAETVMLGESLTRDAACSPITIPTTTITTPTIPSPIPTASKNNNNNNDIESLLSKHKLELENTSKQVRLLSNELQDKDSQYQDKMKEILKKVKSLKDVHTAEIKAHNSVTHSKELLNLNAERKAELEKERQSQVINHFK